MEKNIKEKNEYGKSVVFAVTCLGKAED